MAITSAGQRGNQAGAGGEAAAAVAPLVDAIFGARVPVRFEFWDGSSLGPADGPGVVQVRRPDALQRLVWAPGELGLGRAFVEGDLDVDGDFFWVLQQLGKVTPSHQRFGARPILRAVNAARSVGALKGRPTIPTEEVRPHGALHSKRRDADAISHHYDIGNDFHRLVLGPSMTYSCARFVTPTTSLEDAQAAKHELICQKLGLADQPEARLLDVGCGWGSMAIHAAQHHGAHVVGVTISRNQADLARKRVADAGLEHLVEIRLQDYREVADGPYDAISSIGMFEHVGRAKNGEYFGTLRALLRPKGRLLNHAISSIGGSQLGRRTFMYRYVFPDSDLQDVGEVVLDMERSGFEVRDVESLREHYGRTLRCWYANLIEHWDEAVAEAGLVRARVWWLYTAACAISFEDGGLGVHQVLGVVPETGGASGMPPTRTAWG